MRRNSQMWTHTTSVRFLPAPSVPVKRLKSLESDADIPGTFQLTKKAVKKKKKIL